MITGFNTDIKHGERVFHVQTEDRGLGNPVVESLVYVGGEILLSKKSPYKDQIQDGRVDEKTVKQMMDLQHRKIIEAIRRGRFDGAKPGDFGTEMDGEAPDSVIPTVSPAAAAAAAAILSGNTGPIAIPASLAARPAPPKPQGKSVAPVSTAQAPARTTPPPSPSRAPSGVGSPKERSLDQVIIDYLASEAASEHLELSLMKGGELVSGHTVALSVQATTSLTGKPVSGAAISIRVVSTVGPPRVLYRGVTGNDGLVKVSVSLPEVGSANAALIIAASSPIGNNEIKQLLKRG